MCGGLKDSFSSTLVYRLRSFTLHTLTSTNTHTQHRALDSVEWGAALLAVRLLFGTFCFVYAGRACLRLVWLWTSVLCHSEVSMSLGLCSFCVVFGCDGDAWLGGFGSPRATGWITNGLLSLSPSASGSWGLFLFSQLFISPSLSSKFHDTHSTQDCWFVYLCFCCFLFQLLCFSLLVFCILFLRAAPVGDPSWFSSWALSYWSHVFFYFLLFSSLSAFLYYTCAHILWILMEMNK